MKSLSDRNDHVFLINEVKNRSSDYIEITKPHTQYDAHRL